MIVWMMKCKNRKLKMYAIWCADTITHVLNSSYCIITLYFQMTYALVKLKKRKNWK